MLDYCTTLNGRLSNEWSKKIGKSKNFFCFFAFLPCLTELYLLKAEFRILVFPPPSFTDVFFLCQGHEIAAARKNVSCAPPQRCPELIKKRLSTGGACLKIRQCSHLFFTRRQRHAPTLLAVPSTAFSRIQLRRRSSSLDPVFLNVLFVSPCTKFPISFFVQYFASAKKEEGDCSGAASSGTRLSEKQPSGRCRR